MTWASVDRVVRKLIASIAAIVSFRPFMLIIQYEVFSTIALIFVFVARYSSAFELRPEVPRFDNRMQRFLGAPGNPNSINDIDGIRGSHDRNAWRLSLCCSQTRRLATRMTH
jgi:hypothetical protein